MLHNRHRGNSGYALCVFLILASQHNPHLASHHAAPIFHPAEHAHEKLLPKAVAQQNPRNRGFYYFSRRRHQSD